MGSRAATRSRLALLLFALLSLALLPACSERQAVAGGDGGAAPAADGSGAPAPDGGAVPTPDLLEPCGDGGTTFCTPRPLARGADLASSIAVDRTHVYFTALYGQRVGRVPRTGGAVQVIAGGQRFPSGLAITAGHAVWLASDGSRGVLRQVPVGGGSVRQIASWDPELGDTVHYGLARVVQSVGRLFWPAGKRVMTIEWGGRDLRSVARESKNSVQAILVDGLGLVWATREHGGVSRAEPGRVRRLPPGTTTPVTLVGQGALGNLALHGGQVYWGTTSDLRRQPTGGGSPPTVVASGVQPHTLAVHGAHLYWIERSAGRLVRRSLSTGATEVLARGLDDPIDLAVDDQGVYWAETGGTAEGSITMLPRR
jgi:sugar lactone lactonase YvrE